MRNNNRRQRSTKRVAWESQVIADHPDANPVPVAAIIPAPNWGDNIAVTPDGVVFRTRDDTYGYAKEINNFARAVANSPNGRAKAWPNDRDITIAALSKGGGLRRDRVRHRAIKALWQSEPPSPDYFVEDVEIVCFIDIGDDDEE